MATQASTITYLSLPGQAYENGIAFIQNYFGLPLALIIGLRRLPPHLPQARRLHRL
jgi:Na+/proline symporter